MGSYFMMSKRFNKACASDFGLIAKGTNMAIDPNNGSIWIKRALYDFGWGKENGFYKAPLPDYDALLKLALYGENQEDVFGAAAIILDDYPEELLDQCEFYISNRQTKEFRRLIRLFHLRVPRNRSSIKQKSPEQIQSDYVRWKRVSNIAERYGKS